MTDVTTPEGRRTLLNKLKMSALDPSFREACLDALGPALHEINRLRDMLAKAQSTIDIIEFQRDAFHRELTRARAELLAVKPEHSLGAPPPPVTLGLPPEALPARKEWDAGCCDRGDVHEAYESSDYVDGWNDALQEVETRWRARAPAENIEDPCQDPQQDSTDQGPQLQAFTAHEAPIKRSHTDNFFHAVQLEAARQIEGWGITHSGDTPEDWLALLGYLVSKTGKAHYSHDSSKLKQRLVMIAAIGLNWFRTSAGDTPRLQPDHGALPPGNGAAGRSAQATETTASPLLQSLLALYIAVGVRLRAEKAYAAATGDPVAEPEAFAARAAALQDVIAAHRSATAVMAKEPDTDLTQGGAYFMQKGELPSTPFDTSTCRRLAMECREDDERMSLAPWFADTLRSSDDFGMIKGPWPIAQVMHDAEERPLINEDEAAYEIGDIEGIARARNRLPVIAAQLTAAAEMAERYIALQADLDYVSIKGSHVRDLLEATQAKVTELRQELDYTKRARRDRINALLAAVPAISQTQCAAWSSEYEHYTRFGNTAAATKVLAAVPSLMEAVRQLLALRAELTDLAGGEFNESKSHA